MSRTLLDLLDVEGWRAKLFVLGPDGESLEDAPDGMDVDDPLVLRREQWIVAGDQYIFAETPPVYEVSAELEWGEEDEDRDEDVEQHNPYKVEHLLPTVERALARGQHVHPCLLAALAVSKVDHSQFVGKHISESLRQQVMEAVEAEIQRLCPRPEESVGIDVLLVNGADFHIRPRVERPLRKLNITIVP